MATWKLLYVMVWLVFLQIIIILLPRFTPYLVHLHLVLGLIVLILAHVNYARLKRTDAPTRLKRTAKATAILATIQVVLGLALFPAVVLSVAVPFVDVITFFHLVIALAIITQASSVATAFDMWEEHEFAAIRNN